MTEITFVGPTFRTVINSNLHDKAWMEKIMMNDLGILAGELYSGPEELLEVFKGLLELANPRSKIILPLSTRDSL